MMNQLQKARYFSLATKKRDGSMVATPVWFSHDNNADNDKNINGEKTFYVFSADDAGKVKRLRNFSNVTMAPCTITGRSLGGTIHGHGELMTDQITVQHAYRLLQKKYGVQLRLLDFFSRLGGKFHRRVFIKIRTS
ncbi:MAG: PPOX class probable F420-dependent enzyme [Oceanicoccus sp.]|jgi:PPOX class probable F420-dependent enzyme